MALLWPDEMELSRWFPVPAMALKATCRQTKRLSVSSIALSSRTRVLSRRWIGTYISHDAMKCQRAEARTDMGLLAESISVFCAPALPSLLPLEPKSRRLPELGESKERSKPH